MAVTTQTAQLPDYAKPYVQDMLAQTQAYTDVNSNPYQQYQGQRVAGLDPLQQKAYNNASNMKSSGYLDEGAGIARLASDKALSAGADFQPGRFDNQYRSPGAYQAQSTGNMYQSQAPYRAQQVSSRFNAPRDYQSAQITSQNFGQRQASDYMSPYMQSVVERQQQDAQRQSDIAGTERQAKAVHAGAFGGSRDAIMRAEAARNLAEQKGDIQAQGLQSAFQQAQAQFNADQGRSLTAQQGTEQSRQFGAGQGLTAAGMGAQYGLGADTLNVQNQQFGYGQGLQNARDMAQYGLAGATLNQADRQFGYGQGVTNAANAANYGQQATQLGEQSRQYGAGLGLQGAQTAMQGANTMGTLGNNQFNQTKDISGLQYLYGAGQQGVDQRNMDVNYNNFTAAQNYPKDMLSFRSNMLNGLPMQSSQTNTPDPSGFSQGIGLLGAIGSFFKKGGAVDDGGEPGLMALMASKYA